jgi:CRISPR-associated exonuclease Cas4
MDASLYTEDDLLPLSGLQHLAYCPRQFALIHLEQAWADNLFTAEGNVLHSRTDEAGAETRGDIHIARSLRLQSLALGLAGIADVVEFHRVAEDAPGLELPRLRGRWRPYPVEYKRGRPKTSDCDEIQVCAQALCLEEMLDLEIAEGALFYGKTRRRKTVRFDAKLRRRTEELAAEMHRLWRAGLTPPAIYGPKCEQCSLLDLCMPRTAKRDAAGYLDRMLDDLIEDTREP